MALAKHGADFYKNGFSYKRLTKVMASFAYCENHQAYYSDQELVRLIRLFKSLTGS